MSNQQRRRLEMSATRFAEFNHLKNARSQRRKIKQNLQHILANLKIHPVKNAREIEWVTSEIQKVLQLTTFASVLLHFLNCQIEEIGERNLKYSGGEPPRVPTGNNDVE